MPSPEWTLRRARADDSPAMLAIRALPETRRYQPIIPGTLDDLAVKLQRRGSAPLTPDCAETVQWTIEAGGEPIGWVSVDVTQRAHHVAAVGYTVHPAWYGRAIATGVVRRVIDLVFDPAGLAIQRLEGVAAVDNTASRRVMERCGMNFEGIARGLLVIDGRRVDHAVYARLAGDRNADRNADDAGDGTRYPASDSRSHHSDPQEPNP